MIYKNNEENGCPSMQGWIYLRLLPISNIEENFHEDIKFEKFYLTLEVSKIAYIIN